MLQFKSVKICFRGKVKVVFIRLFTNFHLLVYSWWSSLYSFWAHFWVHQKWEILDMTLIMKSQLLNLQLQQVKLHISFYLLFNLASHLTSLFQVITSIPLRLIMQVMFAKVSSITLKNTRSFFFKTTTNHFSWSRRRGKLDFWWFMWWCKQQSILQLWWWWLLWSQCH